MVYPQTTSIMTGFPTSFVFCEVKATGYRTFILHKRARGKGLDSWNETPVPALQSLGTETGGVVFLTGEHRNPSVPSDRRRVGAPEQHASARVTSSQRHRVVAEVGVHTTPSRRLLIADHRRPVRGFTDRRTSV